VLFEDVRHKLNVLGAAALGVYLKLALVATFLALAVATASSAARGAFPGKPGRIVFSGQGTLLWSVRADGSGLWRLASRSPSRETEMWPSFSPDGQRLAFIRGLGSSLGQVITARPDGGGQRRIFTGAYGVEWSPDGSELAVIGPRRGALLIMSTDGSRRQWVSHGLDVVSLSWSPDGTRLALAGAPPGKEGGCCLYTVRRNGSALRLIAEESEIFSPEWSPDARRIAYQSEVSRGTLGPLTIVEADGSAKRRFGVGYHPAWSPDGSQIAFGSPTNGGMWAFEVATGFTRRVTEAEVQAGIDWQPLCTRLGGAGRDALRGGTGADLVCGLRGNDTIFGGHGSDRLFGEEGNDRFFARDGEVDVIGCGPGRDRSRGRRRRRPAQSSGRSRPRRGARRRR